MREFGASELAGTQFDLAKYEGLARLDLAGWLHEVIQRMHWCSLVVVASHRQHSGACDFARRVMIRPLHSPSNEADTVRDAFTKSPDGAASVRSMSLAEARELADRLAAEPAADLRAPRSERRTTVDDALANLEAMSHGYRAPYARIVVALDRPEDAIKADFSRWLSAARRERGVSASGAHVAPSKWIELKLLPYFDLTTYALAHNARWSIDALLSALYSDDERSEAALRRALRRTVHPRATALIGGRTYFRLVHAVERELSITPST